jgi:starch synthase (maltosyl-transferring)
MSVPSATARRRAPGRPAGEPALAHLAIECVAPELDCGRFPVKRILGDSFEVSADIFKDGHDQLAARVRYRAPGEREWRVTPMAYDYNSDRWSGGFPLDRIGRWTYTVEAWTDRFGTWRDELRKKLEAGQDVSSELLEGAVLVDEAAHQAPAAERHRLRDWSARLRDPGRDAASRAHEALELELVALMAEYLPPADLTVYDRELAVWVDRERARFAAWYEMFPRSQGTIPGQHATFADAERALPRLAQLGFDVVYLPPIHPIGVTNRKGRNNTLGAGPDDPGSPWAIGSAAGGHTAVEPRLGTLADFEHFVQTAHRLGMEVALDYALQCSPDHPWLTEHPEWFFVRPDGSIKHAENPPKKYEDIYPLNFWCEDREALWNACRDILLFWIARGVTTFRVDNPHTKPFAFWEWLIEEIHAAHPEVIFLSEAFTRPKRMKHLAKLGFTQSYTYFTWRNTAAELREYLTELTQSPMREYFRGNLFTNTPDILHEYLQRGGRPAFRVRLLLAATLSPLYGIYSGFELCENVPLRPGSEEYLDSEKYEIRVRDWNAPGNLDADIATLNAIRRENRALQLYTNLTFHHSENDQILFYRKSARDAGGRNDLLIAVNVDPTRAQETMVHVPLDALDLRPDTPYVVEDLLTGARYTWRGVRNYVRLDPKVQVGHILRVQAERNGGGGGGGGM